MTVSLSEKQQHLVINDTENGQVHVVPVFSVRQIANGQVENKELSQLIAKAYLNELGLR